VALVGQSGSGKSTLANLITRFYDVHEGGIYIDGACIKEVTKKSDQLFTDEGISPFLDILENEDKESRALSEIKIEGSQLLEMIENAIKADSDLLKEKELNLLQETLGELKKSLESSDRNNIEELTKKLNDDSQSFAAKRMDRSIQKALTGKSLNSLEF
jgi:ABC-type oligopeptide transport system ATPase subunit